MATLVAAKNRKAKRARPLASGTAALGKIRPEGNAVPSLDQMSRSNSAASAGKSKGQPPKNPLRSKWEGTDIVDRGRPRIAHVVLPKK
jgi:hypothetical protein